MLLHREAIAAHRFESMAQFRQWASAPSTYGSAEYQANEFAGRWLTLATFVGYAVIYTVIFKPLTPQNIVIGGASGAMPPVLGWAAVTGEVSHDALLLFLIIFAWTPPHFWSLALYRRDDYAKAGIPMLPVTHGDRFTRLSVLLYTIILTAVSLLPFATRMSGYFYLLSAVALDAVYLAYAVRLLRAYSDALARRAFRYSIVYLALLFRRCSSTTISGSDAQAARSYRIPHGGAGSLRAAEIPRDRHL